MMKQIIPYEQIPFSKIPGLPQTTEAAKANDTPAILQASTTGPAFQPIQSGRTVPGIRSVITNEL